MTVDLRDSIFVAVQGKEYVAEVRILGAGLVCGLHRAVEMLAELGCTVLLSIPEGSRAVAGEVVLRFCGSAKAIAMAEDVAMGAIAKPSGVARAADQAVQAAAGRVRIVAGATKKMPTELKAQLRHALQWGGVGGCIADRPFVYLDKNYVRMFGSVAQTLAGIRHMENHTRVIQLRGLVERLEVETRAALEAGAEILMVDTGKVADLDAVAQAVCLAGRRTVTRIAFSGDILLEHIEALCSHDVDILDIGRAIIDAPLADCRMDVVLCRDAAHPSAEPEASVTLHLLDKTELRIEGIELNNVNLTDFAATVADVLGLPRDKIAVIDVRPQQVALDILLPTLEARHFFGREKALLAAVGHMAGVRLSREAVVHSQGILGAISLDADSVPEILARTAQMAHARDVSADSQQKKVITVFPTGFELLEHRIEDTNTPYLCKVLAEAGFWAEAGHCQPDTLSSLAQALAEAAPRCRAVITTGGVGAEDKDCSVEALEQLDAQAVTPCLVRFAKGSGRHVKDSIRLGVAEYANCLLIALPGPHDEVRLVAPLLIQGLRQRWDKHRLAESLAACLRAKFRVSSPSQCGHWHH